MHPHFMNFNMFTWQTRICVIKGGYLWKYDQYTEAVKGSPISLESCTIKHYQKKNYFYLELTVTPKTWVFRYDSQETMDSWLRAIDESKTLAHQIRHNKCQYQDEIDALRKGDSYLKRASQRMSYDIKSLQDCSAASL